MDRLFRSTIDCLETVEELDEFGVGIHFCESGGQPLDLSSAVGRMLITILAAFGEMERNLISERTRMALQHLKDTGKRFTYDKYGWDVDEDNNLVENEKEQYWIEYIKVRYHEDDISISANCKRAFEHLWRSNQARRKVVSQTSLTNIIRR